MEPLYFVMAIMGCGDGSANCAQARVEPVHYQSISTCQASMPSALARNTDLSYPVISATCRSNGRRVVQAHRDNRRGG